MENIDDDEVTAVAEEPVLEIQMLDICQVRQVHLRLYCAMFLDMPAAENASIRDC
jgi:hypothetical protein